MVQNRPGNGVARLVNQFRMISKEPAGHRDRPNKIGRLRYFHMRSVRGKSHRADAKNNSVRFLIGFGVQRDAFSDAVMHSALHEPIVVRVAALHVGHIGSGSGGGLWRRSRRGGKKQKEKETDRGPPPKRKKNTHPPP